LGICSNRHHCARGIENSMKYIIKRDGLEVKRVESELEVVVYFHRTHSYSMDHALKYEGYTIESEVSV
jgi:hypothetical protein